MSKVAPSCEESTVHEDAVAAAQASMPNEDELMDVEDLFSAFSDGTRLRILLALRGGELCVDDLAALVGVTKSAISHQLARLKERELVESHKEGRHVFYALADDHVLELLNVSLEHVRE